MAEPILTLLAAGSVHAGWTSVRLVRSMQQCANSFELGLSERWDAQEARLPVRPGTACTVMLGNTNVITGFVDAAQVGIEAQQRKTDVAGRDKTADLVDCSAVRKPGQWRGAKIEAIAQDLCTPFGVRVRADVDTGKPLASFALQAGESVFEALDRAARIRALLLLSDGAGTLVLTRAGTQRIATALVLGENALKARVKLDVRDRHSSYTVLGQAPGSDYFSGPAVSQVVASALDPGVLRYRPMLMTSLEPDLAVTLHQRVRWEANVRAARSTEVEVTVQGWTHAAGLWSPNHLVQTRLHAMDLDEELLITDVEHTLDEDGTTTTLMLTRRDAFQVLPLRAAGGIGQQSYWTQ